MRVVYVAADGPLQGWAYALDRRVPVNEELELSVHEGLRAVYRVGQGCRLWFIGVAPPTG